MTLETLRDVEVRHLLALQAVAEERSFGKAADRLGFTQSAVSQQIAALERLVGESLFHRPGGPKPVEVTPAGRLILEHASAILDRLELVEDELNGFRKGTTGRLVVGTYQSVSVKVLPEVVSRFRLTRPHLDIRPLESDDNDLLMSLLVEGELDIAFAVGPTYHERIELIELCEDPYVVVSTPDFEPGKAAVPVGALNHTGIVGCRPGDACQVRIEASFRSLGINLRYSFRSSDNAAIQAMVRAGAGPAVMPLLAVDTSDRSVAIRPLEPEIPPRVIAVATVTDRPLSAAAAEFIEVSREVCERVQSEHRAALAPAA